ncbi:hypothetical protein SARC_07069 [Sphaeroforma arctica JP610]|uniref:Uncharacterized protein n=1 Tax=Sphaeroforma arctica JP610 TaxID=667725 RepID=A0A0L0FUR4_9EUKA|nr:hypothetical protein SARC_07069 [Sphaeroforma arctica JP610]KNC80570.1 hypothetical protein SARC_07069 [Sphaeroforma arctica JP610]|eukprot:XP_014154472.1 hypothetical protein SARC_07069 [Sphaeroforma arctica JP610]
MTTNSNFKLGFISLVAIAGLQTAMVVAQDTVSLTPWQNHADDCEVIKGEHGHECLYDAADVPSAGSSDWNDHPDVNIIDMERRSLVCDAPEICYEYLDFTYFQAFLDVPESCEVTRLTIDFDGMDDRSRVSVNDVVVEDSYVYLLETGTSDLKNLVISGQSNRIVITQVDDCCKYNNLRKAIVNFQSSCDTLTCASVPDICTFPDWVVAPNFDDIVCSGDECNAPTCCLPAPTCKEVADSITCEEGFENGLTNAACDPDES